MNPQLQTLIMLTRQTRGELACGQGRDIMVKQQLDRLAQSIAQSSKPIARHLASAFGLHMCDQFYVLRMEEQCEADEFAPGDLKTPGLTIQLLDQWFGHVNKDRSHQCGVFSNM